jgi:hypothetical protein
MALPSFVYELARNQGACYLNTFVPLALHSGAIVVRHKHFYTQTSRLSLWPDGRSCWATRN